MLAVVRQQMTVSRRPGWANKRVGIATPKILAIELAQVEPRGAPRMAVNFAPLLLLPVRPRVGAKDAVTCVPGVEETEAITLAIDFWLGNVEDTHIAGPMRRALRPRPQAGSPMTAATSGRPSALAVLGLITNSNS
jgi:hypothetical protein